MVIYESVGSASFINQMKNGNEFGRFLIVQLIEMYLWTPQTE